MRVLLIKKYHFEKENIAAIRPYNGLFPFFGRGVQIVHTKSGYPSTVIIRTFNRNRLLSCCMRKYNYKIVDLILFYTP